MSSFIDYVGWSKLITIPIIGITWSLSEFDIISAVIGVGLYVAANFLLGMLIGVSRKKSKA